jgi:hypothetical protein
MAENKKSFVAYCDWQETFEELSDEEAGKLVKHLFKYVNDENPETSDKLTKMCFIPIKQSLKRDLKKYEGYIQKQSVNGKKGGRPKNPTLSQITQPFIKEPKKADSVSVSDSVSDINNKGVIDISFEPYKNKYKTYAKKIMQDAGQLETLSRKYKMTADPSVYKPTCEKYLKHFLEHLNIGEDKHERAGLFNKHFDSWLGKQPTIKNVVKEKQIVRYS